MRSAGMGEGYADLCRLVPGLSARRSWFVWSEGWGRRLLVVCWGVPVGEVGADEDGGDGDYLQVCPGAVVEVKREYRVV